MADQSVDGGFDYPACRGSVAVAGPIGFIGIVIPHFAKFIVGHDHRWVLPYCAVLGAILLVTADIGARYLIMPEEVPVGVMTAIIGTPIFVYIARRGFQNEKLPHAENRKRRHFIVDRQKSTVFVRDPIGVDGLCSHPQRRHR